MIVQVQEGQVQGVQKSSVSTGQPFYAFFGIPYAKPPIGDLRFKAPVPIEKWEGIRDCSKEGSECFQVEMVPTGQPKIIGTEDCLYLNVYTPQVPSAIKQKKAVMVYIHGGGFFSDSGTARIYGPDFLIGHDIIYVTLNYRLHVFGFLNTNTVNCPGNAGLKDQLLAMRWVKKNIASFGGDPENITIFGESAGAASVHLHMLSPLSKGTFNRAILQSGTALSPWAIYKEPEVGATEFGEVAGYLGEDLEELVEYLKNVPGLELCKLAGEFFRNSQQEASEACSSLVFIPSVEKIKEGALIPDVPQKLMETASPFPTIVGYTDQEGLLALLFKSPERINSLLSDLSITIKNNFNLDVNQQVELLKEIHEFYFQSRPPTANCKAQLVDLYTDMYFMKFYEAIDYLMRADVPPYIYLFAYDGKSNFLKNLAVRKIHPDLNIKGACHADDLGYLFSQTRFPSDMDDSDKKVVDHICTLWTNFAKNGEPTFSLPSLNWKPHTNARPCYLRIEETLKTFDEKLFEKRLGFWKKWSAHFSQ